MLGPAGSGKTCLLASALYGLPDADPGIDRGRSAGTLFTGLLPEWERLKAGRCPTRHGDAGLDLEVWTEDGVRVRIKERTRTASIRGARIGVLLVVPCGTDDGELPELPEGPDPGLDRVVLTGADRVAGEEHAVWYGEPEAWRTLLSPARADAVAKLGLPVFATSAFGYSAETGFPAWIPGEFGVPIPWRIRPREVVAPMVQVLRLLAGTGHA